MALKLEKAGNYPTAKNKKRDIRHIQGGERYEQHLRTDEAGQGDDFMFSNSI